MNKQKPPGGIEWTRVWGRDGYTWNPTAGCYHGCTWRMPDGSITECYAKTIAEKFHHVYDHGFEHHYWRPHKLGDPAKVKKPAGVFVGSMADLFGHWVPTQQIDNVIGAMESNPQHVFQTLSKFPNRIKNFNPYPNNVWVGVSLPAGKLMSKTGASKALGKYLGHMTKIESPIRFMSIEPLWFDVAETLKEWLQYGGYNTLPMEWAIIGAASKGRAVYQPEKVWVDKLLDLLDMHQIPVFFKGNLEYPEWREEFPRRSL